MINKLACILLACLCLVAPMTNKDSQLHIQKIITPSNYSVSFTADGIFSENFVGSMFEENSNTEPLIFNSKSELDNYTKQILREYKKFLKENDSSDKRTMLADFIETLNGFYSCYNEDFFKTKNLVMAKIESGSGSLQFNFDKLETNEKSTLFVTVTVNYPFVQTMDYRNWVMMLEVSNSYDVDKVVINKSVSNNFI